MAAGTLPLDVRLYGGGSLAGRRRARYDRRGGGRGLQALRGHFVRPLWRWRFDLGPPGMWRSVTPELARIDTGGTLLSVTFCVNGTGGCSQEFALRSSDGRWRAIRQAWLNQLPQGHVGRIRHGARIDPYSRRAKPVSTGMTIPIAVPPSGWSSASD